jgi:hypothetical protein
LDFAAEKIVPADDDGKQKPEATKEQVNPKTGSVIHVKNNTKNDGRLEGRGKTITAPDDPFMTSSTEDMMSPESEIESVMLAEDETPKEELEYDFDNVFSDCQNDFGVDKSTDLQTFYDFDFSWKSWVALSHVLMDHIDEELKDLELDVSKFKNADMATYAACALRAGMTNKEFISMMPRILQKYESI